MDYLNCAVRVIHPTGGLEVVSHVIPYCLVVIHPTGGLEESDSFLVFVDSVIHPTGGLEGLHCCHEPDQQQRGLF